MSPQKSLLIDVRYPDGRTAEIVLSGRFDFNSTIHFIHYYNELLDNPSLDVFLVNLAEVDYLDSSALGVMVAFKEELAEVRKQLKIVHSGGQPQQVLEMSHLDKFFAE